ncbi:hypothetical protein GA0061070_1002134 [Kosakonia oryziphila]|uniref:Uncharacterized protein n=1 Tax=Kosakonia oryziphila TaxID=1005667 RepID=A0A1C3ZSP0_9ENTR|nr:hypothetical protein GA0061070_1002134 [Kosakonia oryziphila]
MLRHTLFSTITVLSDTNSFDDKPLNSPVYGLQHCGLFTPCEHARHKTVMTHARQSASCRALRLDAVLFAIGANRSQVIGHLRLLFQIGNQIFQRDN